MNRIPGPEVYHAIGPEIHHTSNIHTHIRTVPLQFIYIDNVYCAIVSKMDNTSLLLITQWLAFDRRSLDAFDNAAEFTKRW